MSEQIMWVIEGKFGRNNTPYFYTYTASLTRREAIENFMSNHLLVGRTWKDQRAKGDRAVKVKLVEVQS